MSRSAFDELISGQLHLSQVAAPFSVGNDVLWPIAAMAIYVVMVAALQRDAKTRGTHRGVAPVVVQAYNIYIIIVSAGILVPTIFFRISGAAAGGTLQGAYCPPGGSVVSSGLRLCLWAYHVSKYTEYADTVFLVLKGKPVGNLHYFHHLVVTFTSWMWFRCEITWVADGVIFNTFVHCIMYYYYYLAGVGRPPWWKKYVTALQIFQFVMSFVATSIWAYYHFTVGCSFLRVILFSVAFNGWLLVMFISFFMQSYSKKK